MRTQPLDFVLTHEIISSGAKIGSSKQDGGRKLQEMSIEKKNVVRTKRKKERLTSKIYDSNLEYFDFTLPIYHKS
jgi:hypothetical protein